jgi:hypothetical protein
MSPRHPSDNKSDNCPLPIAHVNMPNKDWRYCGLYQVVLLCFLSCLSFHWARRFPRGGLSPAVSSKLVSTFFKRDPSLNSDEPKSLGRAEEGLTFSRTILQFPIDSKFLLHIDNASDTILPPLQSRRDRFLRDPIITRAPTAVGGCSQVDDYGNNECHFPWNSDIAGYYSVRFSTPLQAQDYLQVDLKVGTPCTITD